jgi:hypothetical protein
VARWQQRRYNVKKSLGLVKPKKKPKGADLS